MLTHERVASWNIVLLATVGMAGSLGSCKQAGPPYSATEALETFQLEPGFQMDLFAHEPDVADPVAMEIDEYGRIYVVESPGYPLETGRLYDAVPELVIAVPMAVILGAIAFSWPYSKPGPESWW